MAWVKVMSSDQLAHKLPKDGLFMISYKGTKVAICRSGEEFTAVENGCPHLGESFKQAKIHNGEIICPLHEYRFNLNTGSESQSRCGKIKKYQLRIEEESLWIQI